MTIGKAIFLIVASGLTALAMNSWLDPDNFWFRWATILLTTVVFSLLDALISRFRRRV